MGPALKCGSTKKIKDYSRAAALFYVLGGSAYVNTLPITGHPSADIHAGRIEPTNLDKTIARFFGAEIGAKQK